MNFCGPRLEEMLLSGEAVYKNAPLGYGALMALQVPEGKSFIITKINLQPFLNILDANRVVVDPATFVGPTQAEFGRISERMEYSLLVYNDRVSNRFQLRSEMSLISTHYDTGLGIGETWNNPSIHINEKNIDCFMIIEETTFFFFSFPAWETLQYSFQLNTLQTVYLRYNSFPEGPAGYDPTFQTIEAVVIPVLGGFTYLPLGIVNTNTSYNNTTNVITIPSISTDTQITFPYPNNALTNGLAYYQPSLPLFNVEYIEINKRTTTKGI